MPSFKNRSYQPELLDGRNIPFEDIQKNMHELDLINTRLGGHAITLSGVKKLVDFMNLPGKTIHIAEIGCGGGDNLRVIKNWAAKNGMQIRLTGIDINPECIRFAEEKEKNKGIDFICSDYCQVSFSSKPDIIFSSLFCHHFTEEELLVMFQWMKKNTSTGFFINDLHRHPFAYYSIKWLTSLFSKSYLVKNDAPLSVRRGFIKKDWETLFNTANLQVECQWKWAFRWLVIYKHHEQ